MIAFPGIHGNAASNAADRWKQNRLFYDGDIFTHTKKMNFPPFFIAVHRASPAPDQSPQSPIHHPSEQHSSANIQESSRLVHLWHAQMMCRHREETCEFIDLHLKQMADNLIMRYITERWTEEGKPLKTVPGL